MKLSDTLMLIGGIGIALSGIGLVLDRFYPPQLHFTKLPPEATRTVFSNPQRLIIPDLAVDLPIEPGDIIGETWSISPNTANHLQTSARPGGAGNIVIYGHDSRAVLGALKKARLGQDIVVHDATGTAHTYRIEKMSAVSPTDISLIQPTDKEILTVYTCTGLFNEQRLVIQAKPITG